MFATSNQLDTPKLSYKLNVLIAIAQLGNAIAGGRQKNRSGEKNDGCASNCARALSVIESFLHPAQIFDTVACPC